MSVLAAFFAMIVADECDDIACPYNYDPICAKPKSGGKAVTFGNQCAIKQYECQSKKGI